MGRKLPNAWIRCISFVREKIWEIGRQLLLATTRCVCVCVCVVVDPLKNGVGLCRTWIIFVCHHDP